MTVAKVFAAHADFRDQRFTIVVLGEKIRPRHQDHAGHEKFGRLISKLRALRVLCGESILGYLVAPLPPWAIRIIAVHTLHNAAAARVVRMNSPLALIISLAPPP